MGAFAASLGVNVPEWQPVQSKEQALSQAAEWGYPVVLKGEAGSAGNEVVICHEAAALTSALTWLSGHTVFLQRHVRGANWGCGAFFHKGQITHVHCYEILKQQPAGVGAACLVRHDLEPAAVSAVADMGAALQWTGYFQCDFIRDDAGAFWFLEINPRPWGSMTAALASGIPIFQPLIDTLSGRTPVPDIVDNRGWTGGVFPKPLPHMAVMGEWFSMAMTVLSPSFWRGFPRTHRSLLTYFAKVTYWNARWALRHRPDRQKHAAERKHSGINLNAG